MAKTSRAMRRSGGNATVTEKISPLDRSIISAKSPIDESKAGASYRKLPDAFKRSIERNLVPSDDFIGYARSGSVSLTDEWTTSVRGMKGKQKVITAIKDGKVHYTVKSRNKVLLQTNDKNRVANKIAEFYLSEMKAMNR